MASSLALRHEAVTHAPTVTKPLTVEKATTVQLPDATLEALRLNHATFGLFHTGATFPAGVEAKELADREEGTSFVYYLIWDPRHFRMGSEPRAFTERDRENPHLVPSPGSNPQAVELVSVKAA